MSTDEPTPGGDWVSPGPPLVGHGPSTTPPGYFTGPAPTGPPPPGWGAPPPAAPYGVTPAYPPPYGYGAPYGFQPPKPGVIPLRPLGVGELLDGSFTTIRRYPGATLGLAAVVMLVVQFVNLFLTYYFLNGVASDTVTSNGTIEPSGDFLARAYSVQGLVLFVTMVATLLLSGALALVMGQAALGRPMSLGQLWERTKPQLRQLVLATFVVPGIVLGVVFLGALPGLLVLFASTDAGIALAVLGGLSAGVYAIYLAIALGFTTSALTLEKLTVREAIQRSRSLVRGSWWRVFGIYLLGQLIAIVIAGIIQVPFAVIGGFGSFFSSDTDTHFHFSTLLITGIGGLIASTLVRPFTAGLMSLLYLDRRMRSEALDLTLQRAAAQ